MQWCPSPVYIGYVATWRGGRIVLGPDRAFFFCTLILLVSCSIVFVAGTNTVFSARILVGIFATFAVVSLLVCSLGNPGICTKHPAPSAEDPPHESQWLSVQSCSGSGCVSHHRVEQKWCYSCNIYRPFRAVHCRYCDVCVIRRDHHCPWTGTCIGAYNYRSYLLFLLCSSILFLASIAGGILSLMWRVSHSSLSDQPTLTEGQRVLRALKDTYGFELLLIVLACVFVLLTAFLVGYHTFLMTRNQTSNDRARAGSADLFNKGSVWANIRASLSYVQDYPPLYDEPGEVEEEELADLSGVPVASNEIFVHAK